MDIAGKVVVVTGGASGIGRAICERAAEEGAAGVAVADLDPQRCEEVAEAIAGGGTRAIGVAADVAREDDVVHLIERVEAELGPIDLYCSNAGVAIAGGPEVPDADWQRIWSVNVMAHVYAARALVPRMVSRKKGAILVTASAAGLLTNLGSAPYTVTKHAAVALAEWLAITYGDDGLEVSCLCPQGVRTPLLESGLAARDPAAAAVLVAGELLEPREVAQAVVTALAQERFLVLPHPEVATYMRNRAEDPTRWVHAMRRTWARLRQAEA